MTKTYQRLTLLALLLAGAGCEKSIEVIPEAQIVGSGYWKTSEDVQAYMTGIYSSMRGDLNTTVYGEDRGDYWNSSITGRISVYWSQNITAQNGINWAGFYNTIYHCNLLQKNTPGIPFAVEADKNRLLAESYFVRAYTYFTLAKIFGDVPLVLQATDINTINALPARSPVKEVFVQINKDIDQAIGLFPEEGYRDKNRGSKPAAYALRAEVKTWTAKVLGGGAADLTAAVDAINQVEKSGVTLLSDFNAVFDTRRNAEVIFALYFNYNETGSSMYARFSVPSLLTVSGYDNLGNIAYTQSFNSDPAYQPSPEFKALFDPSGKDKRQRGSYIDGIVGGKALYGFNNKYRGTLALGDRFLDNDMMIFRWGEMLLLRAEANAALGKVTEALADLNLVRKRAGLGDYAGAKDKTTVEKEILDDRARELFLENERWWDLVRAHKAGLIDVYKVVPNLVGKKTPLYFSVAQQVIAINPNIKQTEGY